jgi:hypothetical protein
MKREDYLKALRHDETFKKVLSQATSEQGRRAIKAYTEDFIINFFNIVVDPLGKAMEKDPELIKKVYSEIENGLINSGSLEDQNATDDQ